MAKYEGFSNAKDADAGFRAATNDAFRKYKADKDAPTPPRRLRVTEMYVEVENPIHGYIVVLEPQP
jgi:hypothetical protein